MPTAVLNTQPFGTLHNGTTISAVELTNAAGMRARIIALGATLQSLHAPDRTNRVADVVLGHSTPDEYLAKAQYFGATVGRFANRIANGTFSLDGRIYQLDTNDGSNHLHGGFQGFDKAVWQIASANSGDNVAKVTLTHVDTDGAGGYPGTVRATASFTLDECNELAIEYRATTDAPTIVNITNHSYFNLAGEASGRDVMNHRLTLFADAYTPIDATSVPTGEVRSVAGTPFDFRRACEIGERIRTGQDAQLRLGRGYDHNFVVRGAPGTLRAGARLEHAESGRVMELLATAPGLQVYSGNLLDGSCIGKGGRLYRQGDGLCLEPQVFPDAPNHADFPSARLRPGEEFVSAMKFRFSVQ
jgi:aldose 1-epimerase